MITISRCRAAFFAKIQVGVSCKQAQEQADDGKPDRSRRISRKEKAVTQVGGREPSQA